ncbi:MAG: hypothetical protein BWX86_02681 [Verrucomicrobia bacterium ADurb.Bin122]|nr:MAG: hypothetical protein BWX86_02681 [Verrucomicrobia bacterium ADurb.Bin122]
MLAVTPVFELVDFVESMARVVGVEKPLPIRCPL